MKPSIFSAVLVTFFIIFASLLSSSSALAAIPDKMIDYAWAPNFGWINFGSRVSISPTGDFSGYGWSPNIGWIRMGTDLTGPTTVPTEARGNVKATAASNNITGWMRACSIYQSGCTGNIKETGGTERGGWDGWFKMVNVTYDSLTKKYGGFAWGALVGGWVNFGADASASTSTQSFAVSCEGYPTPAKVGDTVTWEATASGPGLLPYTYKWYETSNFQNFGSPIVGDTGSIVSTSYTDADTYFRKVTVTDSSVPATTTSAICVASASRGDGDDDGNGGGGGGGGSCDPARQNCGVVISPIDTCSIKVTYKNTVDGDSVDGYQDKYPMDVPCEEEQTLVAKNGVQTKPIYWNEGACPFTPPVGAAKASNFKVTVSSGTKDVCANFGGGATGDIVISGGNGAGKNQVNITEISGTPINYPVTSRPVAKVSVTSGSGNVSLSGDSWTEMASLATEFSGPNCAMPQLCFGEGINNCVDAGQPGSNINVTTTKQDIQFYFPKKCPGSNGKSVFNVNKSNRNSQYWPVTLTVGSKTKTLILWFNDPKTSN